MHVHSTHVKRVHINTGTVHNKYAHAHTHTHTHTPCAVPEVTRNRQPWSNLEEVVICFLPSFSHPSLLHVVVFLDGSSTTECSGCGDFGPSRTKITRKLARLAFDTSKDTYLIRRTMRTLKGTCLCSFISSIVSPFLLLCYEYTYAILGNNELECITIHVVTSLHLPVCCD